MISKEQILSSGKNIILNQCNVWKNVGSKLIRKFPSTVFRKKKASGGRL